MKGLRPRHDTRCSAITTFEVAAVVAPGRVACGEGGREVRTPRSVAPAPAAIGGGPPVVGEELEPPPPRHDRAASVRKKHPMDNSARKTLFGNAHLESSTKHRLVYRIVCRVIQLVGTPPRPVSLATDDNGRFVASARQHCVLVIALGFLSAQLACSESERRLAYETFAYIEKAFVVTATIREHRRAPQGRVNLADVPITGDWHELLGLLAGTTRLHPWSCTNPRSECGPKPTRLAVAGPTYMNLARHRRACRIGGRHMSGPSRMRLADPPSLRYLVGFSPLTWTYAGSRVYLSDTIMWLWRAEEGMVLFFMRPSMGG